MTKNSRKKVTTLSKVELLGMKALFNQVYEQEYYIEHTLDFYEVDGQLYCTEELMIDGYKVNSLILQENGVLIVECNDFKEKSYFFVVSTDGGFFHLNGYKIVN